MPVLAGVSIKCRQVKSMLLLDPEEEILQLDNRRESYLRESE